MERIYGKTYNDELPDNATETVKQQPENKQEINTSNQDSGNEISGYATYYDLPGSKTASGSIFNRNDMAGAMTRDRAKIGSTVEVSYTDKSGADKKILVKINDTGPFQRGTDGKALRPLRPDPDKVIDLTPAAFTALAGDLAVGKVRVRVKIKEQKSLVGE